MIELNYLAIDELDIVGALGIAVSGPVLGASLVVGEFGFTTISSHLDKVHGTIETAGELRDIDVEGELLVVGLEHLVSDIGGVHQIDTGANVRTGALGDKLVGERVTASGDTVHTSIVSTLDSAVLGTGDGVGTEGRIPGAAGVAVGQAGGGMQPAPVGIKHDRGLLGNTSTGSGTLSPCELGMDLGGVGANLLGRGDEEEGERDEGGSGGRHDGGPDCE